MTRLLLALSIALPTLASPAAAATWLFGGSTGNFASVAATVSGDATLTAVARRYTQDPAVALTNISQLLSTTTANAALRVSRTAPGIGVAGGGSNEQIDTNSINLREAVLVTTSLQKLRLTGLRLSSVDGNDTLRLYGIGAGGALTSLGFTTGLPARIALGLDGAASFTNTGANAGTTSLTFNNTSLPGYFGYVFTTAVGGNVNFGGDTGQGYRLDTISGATVPEPASWAMLMGGMGLVGLSMRRRTRGVVAA